MIKVALISSYDTDCGIASYVAHLEPALRSGDLDLKIIPLPVKILRATTRGGYKKAASWMKTMCSELKNFDVVNLQLEPGLFGFFPPRQLKRIAQIVRASKALVVTFHAYPSSTGNSFANLFVQPWIFLYAYLYNSCIEFFYRRLSRLLRTSGKQTAYIVHTKRERLTMELEGFPSSRIFDHPLAYFPAGFVNASRQRAARENLLNHYRLDAGDYLIGTFGFISPYKGMLTAINALTHLPDKYKLLIFGNVHSMAQDARQTIDPHLARMLDLLKAAPGGLHHRVRFCGTLGDQGFAEAIMGCDSVALPYLEVGQSGSGAAAMALEVGQHLALSRSDCFLELKKYAGEAFDMFDIGNDIELAQLLEIKPYAEARVAARERYRQDYNLDSNVKKYFEAIAMVTAPARA
ncbi:MAG: hypothetical protein WCL16_01650 [bacterium]